MRISFIQKATHGTKFASDAFSESIGKQLSMSSLGIISLCTIVKVDVAESGSYAEFTIDIDDKDVQEVLRKHAKWSLIHESLDG